MGWQDDFWTWFTSEDPAGVERRNAVVEHGGGLVDTWMNLAYQPPPEDLVGRIVWTAGVIGQLIVSTVTFPAAIGSFLLEESAQSGGMGAYLLYTAKAYEHLNTYMQNYKMSLDGFEIAAKTMATMNPVAGGAVLIYLDQAKRSAGAMYFAMLAQLKNQAKSYGILNTSTMDAGELLALIKIAEADKAAQEIIDEQTYGTLALKSVPSNADIYMDGKALGLQTPETFKNLEAGDHDIAVSKYNTKTKKTDSYAATIEIVAGRKKEVTLHIVVGTSDDVINPDGADQGDVPQLPDFIKTTVTCTKMIDGDTFETTTGERIRILGMDAPETGQPIAQTSTDFMATKLLDHKVDIKIQTHLPIDTYGRTLAVVTYRDENVAVSSIANGLAKALIFNDATYDPTRYLAAEALAKERKIGIWDPATPPITWRGG